MRKGISPLVAAVLLIAATMSIAGILSYWTTSYVRTQTKQFENQTTASECNFADFKIYQCVYNSSAQRVNLILENIKTVELKELKLYVEYSAGNVSSAISLNETLPSGAIKPYVITGISNFTNVIVKTQCPEISVKDDCR